MIPEVKLSLRGIRIVDDASFIIFLTMIYFFNKTYYNNKLTVESLLTHKFLER